MNRMRFIHLYNQYLTRLNILSPNDCKVIIIGQDPYVGQGQAIGTIVFCTRRDKSTPSLKNIFKEIYSDYLPNENKDKNKDKNKDGNKEDYKNTDGDLTYLAKQGVLLLNRSLTVLKGKPGSHQKIWQNFTKI